MPDGGEENKGMRAGSRGQIILPVIGRNGYPGADFGAPGWQFEPGRCPVCFNEVVRCLGQRQGWAESLDLCFVYKSPFLDSCDWGGLPGWFRRRGVNSSRRAG